MIPLTPVELMIAAILVPFAAALVIPLFHRNPNAREAVTLVAAGALAIVVWSLAGPVLAGAKPQIDVTAIVPGLSIAFRVEPLGMLFALVAGSLWILNSIYSIGYMRGNDEPRQTSFYVAFAVAIASTMALAFAKNLFTMFLFYEALTLSTYPLVAHKANEEAVRAGRIYLGLLLGSSMLLFLPAIVMTWFVAGSLEFKPGGVFPSDIDPNIVTLLVVLFAFGIGKAALMPLHFWLPAAMVAPTPVSALLHAVAVVKAGVFCIVKVFVLIFGIETLARTGASDWLVYFGAACLLAASIMALAKTNLKARLAYSTVSQLAYVVVGAAVASQVAATGAGMHIATHAVGKITLFFCAGAIYTAAHKTEIAELDGIGRAMPLTMLAFLVGSLSIIGLPPTGGTWSKWFLAMGGLDRGYRFVVAVLMLSSLLNVAYLMSIVGRAFFRPPPEHAGGGAVGMHEAPLACVVPLVLTALGTVVLFFASERLHDLVAAALAKPL
jgi:multicomponent Na+:H+ antiporter subunit D